MEEINFKLSWSDWLLVLGHSSTFAFSMTFYMYACAAIPGIIGTLIGCTSTVYVVVAQYTVLSSVLPGNHNWVEILGVILVLISSVVPSIVKVRRGK